MKLKNLFLSSVAVILSICLVLLLFLATNQNALAKVHKTICTFTKVKTVSHNNIFPNLNMNHVAEASEKNSDHQKNVNKTNQQSVRTQTSYDFNPQECKVIALNYVENHLSKKYNIERIFNESLHSVYVFSSENKLHQTKVKVNKSGTVHASNINYH